MRLLLLTLVIGTVLLAGAVGTADIVSAVTVTGLADMGNFAFGAGFTMQDARNSLSDTDNFGPTGTIGEPVTILPDITGPITAAKLVGVDVFITTILRIYTVDEATAVLDFVVNGGALIFYGDVGTNFGPEGNSMSAPFGIDYSLDDFSGGATSGPSVAIDEPTHPIINGPFGISQFALNSTGSIVGQANALTIATLSSGPTAGRPFLVVQDASTGFAGTGKAIWFSDANILANNTGLYPQNEVLFLNTFTWAAMLEPSVAVESATWGRIKSLYTSR